MDFCRAHRIWLWRNLGQVQSLSCSSHSSTWWSLSVMLNLVFRSKCFCWAPPTLPCLHPVHCVFCLFGNKFWVVEVTVGCALWITSSFSESGVDALSTVCMSLLIIDTTCEGCHWKDYEFHVWLLFGFSWSVNCSALKKSHKRGRTRISQVMTFTYLSSDWKRATLECFMTLCVCLHVCVCVCFMLCYFHNLISTQTFWRVPIASVDRWAEVRQSYGRVLRKGATKQGLGCEVVPSTPPYCLQCKAFVVFSSLKVILSA